MNPSPAADPPIPQPALRMAPVDLGQPQQAAALALLHSQAAAQEAALLGPTAEPAPTGAWQPAPDTGVLGVWCGGELLAALAVAPGPLQGLLHITTLVVHPAHQRQGIARALLQAALAWQPDHGFAVTVAEGNVPARALYRSLGFEVQRAGQMGPRALPVLDLRRAAERANRPGVWATPHP